LRKFFFIVLKITEIYPRPRLSGAEEDHVEVPD
jgi:hypothetical protein